MKIYLYKYCLLLVLFLPSCSRGQADVLTRPTEAKVDISVPIDQVEIDKLENIYILTEDNRILRYNPDLSLKYEYNNSLSGDIVSIDATNPQKILCFVKDFNRMIVLDNTLAEIKTIDLSTSEYLDITAVARSNDDRIWIFDPVSQLLVKINSIGAPIFTSNRLSDLNLGSIDPIIIEERSNRVALVDQEIGLLLFDNFGRYLKLIPELYVEHIQIIGQYIFYSVDGKFFQYNIDRYEKKQIEIDNKGFRKLKMTTDYTYLFGHDGLIRSKN